MSERRAYAPRDKLPPMSEDEMRELWRAGDPLASIASKARLRNGIGRREVRRVIFGEERS